MEVLYNGKDISNDTPINSIVIEDDCGAKLDSLKIIFNDTQNMWVSYPPKQNDTLEVRRDGYSTGVMYVDNINPRDNTMILQALPIKAEMKTKKSAVWENITLPILGYQKALANNLDFSAISITPYVYQRVGQQGESDLGFLARLCSLEAALLKPHDNELVIYNEKDFEAKSAVKTISAMDMTNKSFKNSTLNCYSQYALSYNNLSVTAIDISAEGYKGIARSDIPFYSIAEGERIANNLLYGSNKGRISGSFATALDMSVAAGNVIAILDMGVFNGNYFISHITHMPIENVSLFEVRRVLQ